MPLPPCNATGDLPEGIHPASLEEILERFSSGTPQRRIIALRLVRVYQLALATGYVHRVIVFGSFVSEKPDPNDVDVFVLMNDTFDLNEIAGESRILFDHAAAQAHFGASIFWLRCLAALPNEDEAISGWQIKRDGTRRGIVELIEEHP